MNPRFLHQTPAGAKRLIFPVLALAILAAFWPKRATQPASEEPREVPRSELILRDGRLCRVGESNSFSGLMIERYSDGALRSRSMIYEGLLHGLSEGWFTNGQLQVTEHFKHGFSHGLRTKWYSSGRRLSEANIVEGKFNGLYRKWHENGVPAERVEFASGQPVGVSLAYFPSGFLKSRARLEAAKVVEQNFWKDGESDEKLLAQDRTP